MRTVKLKDRCEATVEQLHMTQQIVEELSNANQGRPLQINGWYHSHPGHTVLPSNIDLNQQWDNQEFVNQDFVGLIFSCHNRDHAASILAFQSRKNTSNQRDYLSANDRQESDMTKALRLSTQDANASQLVHELIPVEIADIAEDGSILFESQSNFQINLSGFFKLLFDEEMSNHLIIINQAQQLFQDPQFYQDLPRAQAYIQNLNWFLKKSYGIIHSQVMPQIRVNQFKMLEYATLNDTIDQEINILTKSLQAMKQPIPQAKPREILESQQKDIIMNQIAQYKPPGIGKLKEYPKSVRSERTKTPFNQSQPQSPFQASPQYQQAQSSQQATPQMQGTSAAQQPNLPQQVPVQQPQQLPQPQVPVSPVQANLQKGRQSIGRKSRVYDDPNVEGVFDAGMSPKQGRQSPYRGVVDHTPRSSILKREPSAQQQQYQNDLMQQELLTQQAMLHNLASPNRSSPPANINVTNVNEEPRSRNDGLLSPRMGGRFGRNTPLTGRGMVGPNIGTGMVNTPYARGGLYSPYNNRAFMGNYGYGNGRGANGLFSVQQEIENQPYLYDEYGQPYPNNAYGNQGYGYDQGYKNALNQKGGGMNNKGGKNGGQYGMNNNNNGFGKNNGMIMDYDESGFPIYNNEFGGGMSRANSKGYNSAFNQQYDQYSQKGGNGRQNYGGMSGFGGGGFGNQGMYGQNGYGNQMFDNYGNTISRSNSKGGGRNTSNSMYPNQFGNNMYPQLGGGMSPLSNGMTNGMNQGMNQGGMGGLGGNMGMNKGFGGMQGMGPQGGLMGTQSMYPQILPGAGNMPNWGGATGSNNNQPQLGLLTPQGSLAKKLAGNANQGVLQQGINNPNPKQVNADLYNGVMQEKQNVVGSAQDLQAKKVQFAAGTGNQRSNDNNFMKRSNSKNMGDRNYDSDSTVMDMLENNRRISHDYRRESGGKHQVRNSNNEVPPFPVTQQEKNNPEILLNPQQQQQLQRQKSTQNPNAANVVSGGGGQGTNLGTAGNVGTGQFGNAQQQQQQQARKMIKSDSDTDTDSSMEIKGPSRTPNKYSTTRGVNKNTRSNNLRRAGSDGSDVSYRRGGMNRRTGLRDTMGRDMYRSRRRGDMYGDPYVGRNRYGYGGAVSPGIVDSGISPLRSGMGIGDPYRNRLGVGGIGPGYRDSVVGSPGLYGDRYGMGGGIGMGGLRDRTGLYDDGYYNSPRYGGMGSRMNNPYGGVGGMRDPYRRNDYNQYDDRGVGSTYGRNRTGRRNEVLNQRETKSDYDYNNNYDNDVDKNDTTTTGNRVNNRLRNTRDEDLDTNLGGVGAGRQGMGRTRDDTYVSNRRRQDLEDTEVGGGRYGARGRGRGMGMDEDLGMGRGRGMGRDEDLGMGRGRGMGRDEEVGMNRGAYGAGRGVGGGRGMGRMEEEMVRGNRERDMGRKMEQDRYMDARDREMGRRMDDERVMGGRERQRAMNRRMQDTEESMGMGDGLGGGRMGDRVGDEYTDNRRARRGDYGRGRQEEGQGEIVDFKDFFSPYGKKNRRQGREQELEDVGGTGGIAQGQQSTYEPLEENEITARNPRANRGTGTGTLDPIQQEEDDYGYYGTKSRPTRQETPKRGGGWGSIFGFGRKDYEDEKFEEIDEYGTPVAKDAVKGKGKYDEYEEDNDIQRAGSLGQGSASFQHDVGEAQQDTAAEPTQNQDEIVEEAY